MQRFTHNLEIQQYINCAKDYYQEGIKNPLHLVKPDDRMNVKLRIGYEDGPSLHFSTRYLRKILDDRLDDVLERVKSNGINVIKYKHYDNSVQNEYIQVPGNTWIVLRDKSYIFSSLYVLSEIYKELLAKMNIQVNNSEILNPMFGYVGNVEGTGYFLLLPMFLEGEYVYTGNESIDLELRSIRFIGQRGLIGSKITLGRIRSFGTIEGPVIQDYYLKTQKVMSVGFTGIELEGVIYNDSYDTFFGKTEHGIMIKAKNRFRVFDSRINPTEEISIVDPKRELSISIKRGYIGLKWKEEDPIVSDQNVYDT